MGRRSFATSPKNDDGAGMVDAAMRRFGDPAIRRSGDPAMQ